QTRAEDSAGEVRGVGASPRAMLSKSLSGWRPACYETGGGPRMRLFALAALAVCVSSGPALAAPQIMALAPPAAPALPAAPVEGVRVGMRQQTLPVGGELPEDRQAGERY